MSERPEDLKDDRFGERLKRSLGTTPARLSLGLERLTAAGLRQGERDDRTKLLWHELGIQWIGLGLAVVLVLGILPWTLTHIIAPATPSSHTLWGMLASTGSLGPLTLPLGVLLFVEAMRGTPTLRRWLR